MKKYIEKIKKDNPIDSCIFFKDILNNKISLDDFKTTQYNFYPAVTFFSRPMFIICSKIDDYNIRWKILENIIDEHGEGEESKNHGSTYKSYLKNLKLDCDNINSEKNIYHTSKFNNNLMTECIENHWVKGAAIIAIMEDLYKDISRIIYDFLIENNYLHRDEIIHYKVHKEIDEKHSDDMYGILSEPWENDALNQIIKCGFIKGNDMLLSLLSNLYSNTK